VNYAFNLTRASKWVSYGCSYPGSLAALLRAKHPELVHAAFAASAPMNFRIEFIEYSHVLERIVDSHNHTCRTELAKAYARLDELLMTTAGRALITDKFDSCTSLNSPYDRLM
jgi:pimeloyl-ACP methyl ester carboxylesterase